MTTDTDEHPATTRTPLAIQVTVVLGLVALVFWISRDLWFFDDDWDYLTTRTGGDPDAYLRPHAGHWTLWTVPVFRGLYQLVGLDYFPWYHLPRLLALGLLALLLWRTFERRGAPALVAGAATATFVVLDTSAGHRAISIGNYIVMAALMVVGERLARDEVTTRDRVIVGLALVVAVSAFSSGAIVLGATVVVVLATRRLAAWWPALLPALVVYGLWTVRYGPDRSDSLTPDLLDLPGAMLEVLGVSVGSLLGLSDGLGMVVGLAALVLVGFWAARGRLDRFDALALVTAVAFLAVTAELRAVAEFPLEDRYAFVPIITLALVIVPRIRIPRHPVLAVGLGLFAVLVFAVNLRGTFERADELADFVGDRRPRVETAARLLAEGAPAVGDSWVSVPLTVDGLRRLVDDGWDPAGSADREVEARGHLTVGLGPDSDEDVPSEPTGDECRSLAADEQARFDLDQPRSLLISAERGTALDIRWQAGDEVGERRITWSRGRGQFSGRVGRFSLAAPDVGEAEVEVHVVRSPAPVRLCLETAADDDG